MTTTITQMTIRKTTPSVEVIWYSGKNAVDVARFLQGHGRRATVELHGFGETLSINGYRVDTIQDDHGIWIGSDGGQYTKAQIADSYEVLETR